MAVEKWKMVFKCLHVIMNGLVNAVCICQAFGKSWCSHFCELVISCWDVEVVIVKFCIFYHNMLSKRYISLELSQL